MRPWAVMLGGLLVWTAHFMVIWTGSSVFLTSPAARLVTGSATLVALPAIAMLARAGWRRQQAQATGGQNRFGGWSAQLALLSALAGAIAIVWQALPALLI